MGTKSSKHNAPAYKRGVRLGVTISPKASLAIDELLTFGLHGSSRAEIAQRFIYAGLREAELFWQSIGRRGRR